MLSCDRCGQDIPPESRFCLHCGKRVPRASAGGTIVDRLGRALGDDYTIKGEIGKGGFGVVYEVFDKRLERRLAVKVMRPELVATDVIIARFRREAKIVAQLDHDNVLSITFAGEGEGMVYCAMPLIVGDTLKDRIKKEGKLAVDKALRVFGEIAAGLHHAHQKGIVHRDVKPSNIMLNSEADDRAVLVDFGIAKGLTPSSGKLSISGQVVGSPEYMSPERRIGVKEISPSSDIYSLGVVGYQMLTGRLPFGQNSRSQPTLTSPPVELPNVRRARPDVPKAFGDAVERCLHMKPSERWPDVLDAARHAGAEVD